MGFLKGCLCAIVIFIVMVAFTIIITNNIPGSWKYAIVFWGAIYGLIALAITDAGA